MSTHLEFPYDDEGQNTWNISKTPGTNIIGGPYLGGNYWSCYTGVDTDGDGLGDTEVPHGPGDHLPLIDVNFAPIANFTWLPTDPTTLDIIEFTDLSTDPDGFIVSWLWDFGDGNTSTMQHPTHQYTVAGNYTVCLTVTDDDGASDTFCEVIVVSVGEISVNIPLEDGWNLISVPVETGWTSLDLIANVSGCVMVSWFCPENQTFRTSTGTGYVFPIEPGMGYFVYVTGESMCPVVGLPVVNVSIPLEVGWNMIGWYQSYDTNSTNLMNNISGCVMVSWFDAVDQTYRTSTGPGYVFDISRGMGLFVYVNEASVWYGEG